MARKSIYSLQGKERFKISGLKFADKTKVPGNAPIFKDGKKGRRGHPADVFAAERLGRGDCPPGGGLRQQRHELEVALRHAWPAEGRVGSAAFYDVEKKRRTAKDCLPGARLRVGPFHLGKLPP